MTTFVVGHGSLAADRPKTKVPEGGSITFFTDVDFDLVMNNGMAAVQTGDVGEGYTVAGGQPVENYSLSGLTDNQRVRYETVAKSGLKVVYVGDQIPSDIHLCEGDDLMCGGGRHICGGVFGRLDDSNIVYLACRGVEGAPDRTQRAFGTTGDSSIPDDLDSMAERLLALSEEDCGKKILELEDAKDPDKQELLAHLMAYPDLRKAVYKERTRQSLGSMSPDEFAAMFNGQPETEKSWMQEIPEVEELLTSNAAAHLFDE